MLGIDVSKDTLACTLFDPATQKSLWSRSVPNTASGVNHLLKQTLSESPWALESTGLYNLLAAVGHRKRGWAFCLAQPGESAPLPVEHWNTRQDRCPRQPRHRSLCFMTPFAFVSAKIRSCGIRSCGTARSAFIGVQEPECFAGFVWLAGHRTLSENFARPRLSSR